MYYSDELIEEVRTRNDIVDVISGYVSLKKKGGRFFGLCPFHNERTPSFSVSQTEQMYYCFGCGAGGSVFTFLMQYESLSFPEAVKTLADRAGVALPETEFTGEDKRRRDQKAELLEIQKKAAKYYYYKLFQESGRRAYEYLSGRGLTDSTIKRFGLGYSGRQSAEVYRYLKHEGYKDELLRESGLFGFDEKNGFYDKFWNRVIFPIMDINSRVIGFGGRVMGDAKPKYLNSPETVIFDKGRNLYGLNFARRSRSKNLIICEGYMDVISLHQAGFDQAVASLGTALTSQQALLMKRYASDILVTYDSDEAGTKAALRAIPILKEAGLRVRVIDMQPYKDPDEFIKALGTEAFQERIDNAAPSFIFEIGVMEKRYDLKDPESKTAFFDEVSKKLLEFTDEIERNNYIEAVASKYGTGYETLRRRVNTMGMTLGGGTTARPAVTPEKRREKPAASEVSQKLLLSLFVSDAWCRGEIKKYVKPEDFSEGICRGTAALLYEQGDDLRPAVVINHFETAEEQNSVASIFNAKPDSLGTGEEMKKALRETIYRVLKESLDKRARELEPTDLEGLQRLIKDRRELERLKL